jgi:hypothetical protein
VSGPLNGPTAAPIPVGEASELLLHRLRVQPKVSDAEAPAEAVAPLVAAGWAHARGRWVVLTPAGRAEADVRFRLDPDSDAAQRAGRAYEQFLPRNAELLRLCTDWQVRPGGTPNDHRDQVYDWSVIDRLVALDERIAPVLRRLGREAVRFAPYRERLRTARRKVEAGEHDWFASPRLDSYHTGWMQRHADLLLALGIERASEPGAGGAGG